MAFWTSFSWWIKTALWSWNSFQWRFLFLLTFGNMACLSFLLKIRDSNSNTDSIALEFFESHSSHCSSARFCQQISLWTPLGLSKPSSRSIDTLNSVHDFRRHLLSNCPYPILAQPPCGHGCNLVKFVIYLKFFNNSGLGFYCVCGLQSRNCLNELATQINGNFMQFHARRSEWVRSPRSPFVVRRPQSGDRIPYSAFLILQPGVRP